jgi:tetratricopeptide (TPR) repeat protein
MFMSIAPGLMLYVLLGIVASVYSPGLDGGLILDDYANLAPLEDFTAGRWSWLDFMWNNESGPLGRPVAMLSFAANYLTGGDIHSLKATNLALHLLCGALIFWLAGRLFVENPATRTYRWWLALWTAAMWLCSPLYVSTVLYVIQRMAQLAALFSLLGVLLYVIGRQLLERRYRLGITFITASLLLCWPLATLSKENGALLPLLLLVMEGYWFHFQGTVRARAFLKRIFFIVLGMPAIVVVVLIAAHPAWVLGGYSYRDFTLTERLLTEARVLWDYIGALLYPQGSKMGVFHDDFPVSKGLWSPPSTALAVVMWIAVAWMALRQRTRWIGLILSGVMFFLVAHLLESSVFPLEPYFEHRNYLPGAGIYLSCAAVAGLLFSRLSARRKNYVVVLLTILLVEFAVATYQRVLAWETWDSILLTTAAAHPNSARVHADLANWYAQRGDRAQAFRQIDEVDRLAKEAGLATTLHRIVVDCWTHASAGDDLYVALRRVKAFDMSLYTNSILDHLADLADEGECRREIDYARLAAIFKRLYANTVLHKDDVYLRNMHLALARIFRRAGDMPAALAHLTDAMEILPTRLEAGLVMLRYLVESGDLVSAAKLVPLLKQRDGGRVSAYTQMLEQYERMLAPVKPSVVPSATVFPSAYFPGRRVKVDTGIST